MKRLGLSWAGDQLYQSDPFSLLTYIPFPGRTNFHELFRPRFLSQLCHPLGITASLWLGVRVETVLILYA